MKISKKSEYAIRALIEMTLQTRGGQQWRQTSQIAENSDIPEKYLEQILLNLKKGGFLKSKRGIDGGYALNLGASAISLYDVFLLLEGNLEPDMSAPENDPITYCFNKAIFESSYASREVLKAKSLSDLTDDVERLRAIHQHSIEYQI